MLWFCTVWKVGVNSVEILILSLKSVHCSKMDFKNSGPPADVQLQVHPQVRHIDVWPISKESQQARVISLVAVAMTPDGGGNAVGCTVIQDF